MKANKIAIIICALLCVALLMGACKSEEQLAEAVKNEPTVISPDVNITQEAPEAPDVLNVTGSGKVVLTPDTATFYTEIYTEAKTAAEAQSDNAALTEAVTAAIIAAGVAEKNIKTSGINLSEIYDYDKSPAVIAGYRMTTSLLVTVTPIEKAGAVMGAAIAAGATGTHGLTFTVSDTSKAYQQALQIAIEDAAGKAEAMAETLGVKLSAVPVSVTESSRSQPVYSRDDNKLGIPESAADAVDMPISIGEITVSADVGVVYEMLEP